MGGNSMVGSQEDTDSTLVTVTKGLVLELRSSLDETLHIQDVVQGGVLDHVPTLGKDEIGHSEEGMMCPELKVEQSSASIANTQKSFSKSATFPSSEKMLSSSISIDSSDEESESRACARSMSLPTSLKLVSAMKGGREQQGTYWKMKLNVKWADDVYDPPSTSLSHTVKSHHHQRPKNKRRDHKHKHSKGKSTRGNNNEKKHHMNRKSSVPADSLRLRLQAHDEMLPLDGFGESSLQAISKRGSSFLGDESGMEVVSTQDSKCGSSFLRASLAKVHLSVA
ncbi:uncharacterized protein LOC143848185 [Tasmannia lanceolata]|uniref:uncharacterized protein LOC143848185 n=1 Tax=Tasmannia lanceolata TaxID=3420 RepID=UPI00406346ED